MPIIHATRAALADADRTTREKCREIFARQNARATYRFVKKAMEDFTEVSLPADDANRLLAAFRELMSLVGRSAAFQEQQADEATERPKKAEAPPQGATPHFDKAKGSTSAQDSSEAGSGTYEAAGPDDCKVMAVMSALFPDKLAREHPDSLIEIGFTDGSETQSLSCGRLFGLFDIGEVATFAIEKNMEGRSVYVGVATRKPGTNGLKRASKADVEGSDKAWIDCDTHVQVTALEEFCKSNAIQPLVATITGSVPERRAQAIFQLDRFCTPDQIECVNQWFRDGVNALLPQGERLLDDVTNADRVMRLGGSVSYPTIKKHQRGYRIELTTAKIDPKATVMKADGLLSPSGSTSSSTSSSSSSFSTGDRKAKPGQPHKSRLGLSDRPLSDEEIIAWVEDNIGPGSWHNTVRDACAKLAARGYGPVAIRAMLGQFCDQRADDPDLIELADSAFDKFAGGGHGGGDDGEGWSTSVHKLKQSNERRAALRDKFLRYGEYSRLPPVEWLIDGILPARSTTILFGVSNAFKSFLAADMGCSVATGTPYHGRATKQGKVLYIATEGAFGVGRKRLPAWMAYHRISMELRDNVVLVAGDVLFAGGMEDMIAVIMEVLGESPALIIVDVLAGTMDGSESDDEAAKGWVNAATRLVMKLEAALLVISHSPYADESRMRGHSHLWGSFDSRLQAEGDKDTLTTTLTVNRHKDFSSTAEAKWGFRLIEASPDEHPSETSLVPVMDDEVLAARKQGRGGRRSIPKSAISFMTAFDVALGDHGVVGPRLVGEPIVRYVDLEKVRAEYYRQRGDLENADLKGQAFRRAVSAAVDRGDIQVRQAGDRRMAWKVGGTE